MAFFVSNFMNYVTGNSFMYSFIHGTPYLADQMREEWRKLHNEELHAQYPTSYIIRVIKSRKIKWTGTWHVWGREKGVYRVLMGRPEGQRPIGKPRCR